MNNKDRRKNISFKDSYRDTLLLQYATDKSIEYGGFSAYIKSLIQKDMEEEVEDDR